MRLRCRCDFSIPIATEQGENDFEIIHHTSITDFCDRLAEAQRQAADDEDFRRRAVGVLLASRSPLLAGIECPNCGRLAIGRKDRPKIQMWFVREPGEADEAMPIRSLTTA